MSTDNPNPSYQSSPQPVAAEVVGQRPATEPPARRPTGIGKWILRLFMLGLVGTLGISLLMNVSLISQASTYSTGDSSMTESLHSGEAFSKDKIAIINVKGAIMNGEGFVKQQIDRALEDDAVRAVVLRVDSPGGTVTGSDYIYHHLNKLREKREIPIVVSMGGLCASGGYYVSMAVGEEPDAIFAEPTTWTGSIGVIIPHYDVSEFLAKWNVKDDSFTSGPLKQMGSPTRLFENEDDEALEDKVLQTLVDESFAGFKKVVASGRPKLDKDDDLMDQATTGQIFTANQALKLGLVDKIGFIEDAIEQAAGKANLKTDTYAVVQYEQPQGLLTSVLYGPGASSQPPAQLNVAALLEMTTPRAYYLCSWLPSLAASR